MAEQFVKAAVAPPSTSGVGRAWQFARRYPVLPGVVLIALIVCAVFAPLLSPHDPGLRDLHLQDFPPVWMKGGAWSYPLGTDNQGRDVLSRILYGARISLLVSFIAVSVGLFAGTASGVIAGYFGGLADEAIMRLVDLWSAIPFLLLALVVAVAIGPSLYTVIWLLALSGWSAGARNIRGEVLSIKTREYISFARLSGASHRRIMFRHVLPQVVHIVLVITTLRTGALIIAEAGLSFLGVGVPSSTPTWGVMIGEGQRFLLTNWWQSIFPGVAILMTVMSMNFIGDWLRDYFDPRLRQIR